MLEFSLNEMLSSFLKNLQNMLIIIRLYVFDTKVYFVSEIFFIA